MLTVLSYILLNKYAKDPCPLLYIIPVFTDFALLGKI